MSAAIIGAVFDQGQFFCNQCGVESMFRTIHSQTRKDQNRHRTKSKATVTWRCIESASISEVSIRLRPVVFIGRSRSELVSI